MPDKVCVCMASGLPQLARCRPAPPSLQVAHTRADTHTHTPLGLCTPQLPLNAAPRSEQHGPGAVGAWEGGRRHWARLVPRGAWQLLPCVVGFAGGVGRVESWGRVMGCVMGCTARWSNTVHILLRGGLHTPLRHTRRLDPRRYSMACFYEPNFDSLVECLPVCCGPDR